MKSLRSKILVLCVVAILSALFNNAEVANAATTKALTATEKTQFIQGAQNFGFTAAQAKLMADDPKSALSVPVSMTRTVKTGKLVRAKAIGKSAAANCRSVTVSNVYRNRLHQRLFTSYLTKYWCWDGRTVGYRPQAAFTVNMTAVALGWTYLGVTGRNELDFMPQNGGFWGTQSWAQGSFQFCAIKFGCVGNYYPKLVVNGYGNGAYNLG